MERLYQTNAQSQMGTSFKPSVYYLDHLHDL